MDELEWNGMKLRSQQPKVHKNPIIVPNDLDLKTKEGV